jgi:predicted membrane protein
MTNEATFRVTPRLIVGFGILALGMLWTLDNLNLMESEPITRWWPAILVVIGGVQLLDGRVNKLVPVVLMLVGTLLLLDEAYLIDFDLGDLIPLGIALLGAKLMWEALTRRRARTADAVADSDSVIHAFAMMAGVKRQSTSSAFRGGDANAIMGGVELDLRKAQIRDGETVVIDTFAMWGGVEIQVPENWRVVGNVLPVMGAFEDNTHPNGEPGPMVTIRGTAIMGGIEVKN